MKADALLYSVTTAAVIACAPLSPAKNQKREDQQKQDPLVELATSALHRVQVAGGEIAVQKTFSFQYSARASDLNHDGHIDFSCSLAEKFVEYAFVAEDIAPVGSLDRAKRCLTFGKKKCAVLDVKDQDVQSLYKFCLGFAAGKVPMPWYTVDIPAFAQIEKKKDLAPPAPLQEIVTSIYADISDDHLDHVHLGRYSLFIDKTVVEGKPAVKLQISRKIKHPLRIIDAEPFGTPDRFYQCTLFGEWWFLLITPIICDTGKTPSEHASALYEQAMRAAAQQYYDRGKQGNSAFTFDKQFDTLFDLLNSP